MAAPPLQLHPDDVPEPPRYRGRFMDAKEVAQEIFGGKRGAEWVKRTVPKKKRLAHSTVGWWEYDVLDWIDSQGEPD